MIKEVGEARPRRPRPPRAGRAADRHGARARKVSGSRFAYLLGDLVLLELALVRFALDLLGGRGFHAGHPAGAGARGGAVRHRLPARHRAADLPLADDDLYLIGTSEVPLASLHAGEILDEDDLPLRYAGFSTCFRREAGAAGKDTRGIFRVHQFDKVEMFSFVRAARTRAPSTSACSRSRRRSCRRSSCPTGW